MTTYPVNAGAKDFDPVPAGSHIAVCDMKVDLGMQPGTGAFPKPKRKVYLRFQLLHERVEYEKDGKKFNSPRMIGKTYTASMHEKANLRHDLESWRGRQFTDAEAGTFDVDTVLGKPCMLMVMQTKKEKGVYSDISGIGPLPKGIDPRTIIPEGLPVLYTPDQTSTYQQLPEWLKKAIDNQILEEPATEDGQPEPEQPPADAWDGYEPPSDRSDPGITDDDIPF